jgi:hypothetical protein
MINNLTQSNEAGDSDLSQYDFGERGSEMRKAW